MSGVFRWSAASPFAPLVIVYAAACLVFGGGTRAGFAGDVVLQLAGLPLALWAIWRLLDVERGEGRGRGRGVLAIAVCGAVLGLHALQLIPLPPWLWSLLPERRAMLDALEIVGIEPGWLPISVSPRATWLSAIAFIPSVAVLLGVMQLDLKDRRVLSLAILLVGLASVFLGLLQLAQGPSSPLRFFEITNATEAVGFFANRNHFSALLYCLLLIAAPWMLLVAAQIAAVGGRLQSREALPQLLGLIGTFTVFMMLIGAQTMARSRAGLGLTIAALGGVLMMAYLGPRPRTVESPARSSRRRSAERYTMRFLLAGFAIAAVFLVQFSFGRVMERFANDPMADARMSYVWNTLEAARTYMPFGSGMGTFVPVYKAFEKPTDVAVAAFANRAHNDFLELWLEAGMFGLAAAVLFVAWLVPQTIRVWRRGVAGGEEVDNLLGCAATLALVLLTIHSIVDYPLRTTAMSCVFFASIALALKPVGAASVVRHTVTQREEHELPAAHRRGGRHRTSGRRQRGEPGLADLAARSQLEREPFVAAESEQPPADAAASPPRRRPFTPATTREDWPEAWQSVPGLPRVGDRGSGQG